MMMKQPKAFANLNKAQGQRSALWLGIIASFVVLLSFIFPSHAQTSLSKGQQQIQYDVYAGGIHALQANLNISVRDDARYDVDLTAKTYGLLGRLAPWSGKFESHGWHDTIFKPELHQATTTWRDSDEIKKYNYNKDGSFNSCLLYTSPSPRDGLLSRMPSSA